MINLRRLDVIRLFAVSALLLTPSATSWAQQRPPIADKMAKTHGLDSFGQVEGIRYTFNVERPGVNVSRSWEWNPKTDSISYEGKDKDGKPVKVTYQRSQATGVPEDIDANFLNDQYWLLLPFHVIWDTSAAVTDEGMQKPPLGNGSGEKLVVKYPSDGGYSPGDTWDVYVAPMAAPRSSSITAGDRRSPASSLHPGPTTRRPDRCSSHWIIRARPTTRRCTFSFRMWRSR